MHRIKTTLSTLLLLLFCAVFFSSSATGPGNIVERIRGFTRMIEFDYVDWTAEALWVKNVQETVKSSRYLTMQEQHDVVFEYLRLVAWVNRTSSEVQKIYSNPSISNPSEAAADQNRDLKILRGMEQNLKPIAEDIIQRQVSTTIAEMGLDFAGQPIPPVLYHSTRLPEALIVSPRERIEQEANISLEPEMTSDEIEQLEKKVEKTLNRSALVVPIGGVGTYPTMVMSTTDLPWLLEVVAHEWTHNYLTMRPVGMLYGASPEMRTINETAANIAGKEISRVVLERYYPELAPPPEPTPSPTPQGTPLPTPTPTPEDPSTFNYYKEMGKTRQRVDTLLAEGKVQEAETYMEARRRVFWERGYQIRRLNQAYFAFYGAYADIPEGGAAGRDPVGPAVQELRARSKSLADFLNRLTWMTSFQNLQDALKSGN